MLYLPLVADPKAPAALIWLLAVPCCSYSCRVLAEATVKCVTKERCRQSSNMSEDRLVCCESFLDWTAAEAILSGILPHVGLHCEP